MRRAFERTMQMLLWGVGVTIVWAAIAVTEWGRQRSALGAGPGDRDAVAPLSYVLGALLVSISATLLIQMAASRWKRRWRPTQTQPVVQPGKPPQPLTLSPRSRVASLGGGAGQTLPTRRQ